MGKRDVYWYELSKGGVVKYRTYAKVIAEKFNIDQTQVYMAWKRGYRLKGYKVKRMEVPKNF